MTTTVVVTGEQIERMSFVEDTVIDMLLGLSDEADKLAATFAVLYTATAMLAMQIGEDNARDALAEMAEDIEFEDGETIQ